jgi:hypothetical protein
MVKLMGQNNKTLKPLLPRSERKNSGSGTESCLHVNPFLQRPKTQGYILSIRAVIITASSILPVLGEISEMPGKSNVIEGIVCLATCYKPSFIPNSLDYRL